MVNVSVLKTIDKYLFGLLCCILPRSVSHKTGKKILVIQLWGIGESILTLPAIKSLKNVTVLCTDRNKEIFVGYNFIQKIDVIQLTPYSLLKYCLVNLSKFDVCYDFEEYLNVSSIISYFTSKYRIGFSHGIRSRLYHKTIVYNDKQHVSYCFTDLVETKKPNKLIPINFDKVSTIYPKKKYIIIFPGVAESAKQRKWTDDNWITLIKKLKQKYDIVVCDKPPSDFIKKNKPMLPGVHFIEGPLSHAASIIKKAYVVISLDSGPMHIAESFGKKGIYLFGPNLRERWGYGDQFFPSTSKSLYVEYPCSPCIDSKTGYMAKCPINSACMRSLTPDMVLKEVEG